MKGRFSKNVAVITAILILPTLGAPASLPAIALASKRETRRQRYRRFQGPLAIMRIAAVIILSTAGVVTPHADGLNQWIARDAKGSAPGTVAYGNDLFVATGRGIITSHDGETWTVRHPGGYRPIMGVAYGNGVWVAVGGWYLRAADPRSSDTRERTVFIERGKSPDKSLCAILGSVVC